MVFPVVVYGCEVWTIKKAEQQRIAENNSKQCFSMKTMLKPEKGIIRKKKTHFGRIQSHRLTVSNI